MGRIAGRDCGEEIDARRLGVLPRALRCVPCQARFEDRQREVSAHELVREARQYGGTRARFGRTRPPALARNNR